MSAPTTIKTTRETRKTRAERERELYWQFHDECTQAAHGHEWDTAKQARSDEDRPADGAKQWT